MKREKQLFLVVEDFEDSRFMMRRLLEMAGYDVVEASDGQQAVELAVQERPALILMDLSLPKLDGLAATRLIRQHRDVSKIPIIAVSAHDSPESRSEALAELWPHGKTRRGLHSQRLSKSASPPTGIGIDEL